MSQAKLKAKKRTLLGKKSKKLRREGIIPAVIYGKDLDSVAIEILLPDFTQVYKTAGNTQVIEIEIEAGETYPVLVKQLQYHPLSDLPVHVDFHRIDLKKKVSALVPLVFVGESEVVKNSEGILQEILNQITVEALPSHVPASIVVDISTLKTADDVITISNLVIPAEVVVKHEPEELICKIAALMAEEVEPVVVTPEDVEVATEKKAEEAEATEAEEK